MGWSKEKLAIDDAEHDNDVHDNFIKLGTKSICLSEILQPFGYELGPTMQKMECLANFELLWPYFDFIKSC